MPVIFTQKDATAQLIALRLGYESLKSAAALVGTDVHQCVSGVVTSLDYTLPTSDELVVDTDEADGYVVFGENLVAVLQNHMADDVSHSAKDAAGLAAVDGYHIDVTSTATINSSFIDTLNYLKGVYHEHMPRADIHVNADVVNYVSADDATDEDTAVTLALDLKAQFNAHIADGPDIDLVKVLE
jgi:hypothetical protein